MIERTGTLRLRGRRGPLDARVHWPSHCGTAALVVAFGFSDADAQALCDASGPVVVTVRTEAPVTVEDAWAAVHWVAAHARDLDADGQLLVVGAGSGVATARAVAARADAEGWPPLTALDIADADMSKTASLIRLVKKQRNPAPTPEGNPR